MSADWSTTKKLVDTYVAIATLYAIVANPKSREVIEAVRQTMGGTPVVAKLIDAFRAYPNQDVTIGQLMADTGMGREQIQGCINNLRRREGGPDIGMDIETIVRGNVYRWKPKNGNADDGKQLFERLATLKGGDILLQSDDGKIYRARELE